MRWGLLLLLVAACAGGPVVSGPEDAGGSVSQCLGENDVCSAPDAGPVEEPDAGAVDAGQPDAGGPPCDPDNPETFAEACARYGYDCGVPTIVDRCGVSREVDCGRCSGIGECGAQKPFVCYCVPSTAEERCAAQAAICGSFVGDDNCGHVVTTECGTCPDGKVCNSAGTHCT
jgi:hypothetical protein